MRKVVNLTGAAILAWMLLAFVVWVVVVVSR